MNPTEPHRWQHLEPRRGSAYRQLFLKDTRVRASVVYDLFRDEDGQSPEEIAAEYGWSLDAIREAIAYCQTNPQEVADDLRREEALMEATGMKDPNYKNNPRAKILTPQEWVRIMNS